MGTDFYGENRLSGSVFIDKGTIIKNSKLKDCIILSNCEIVDSEITDSIIDEDCIITRCKIESQMIERGSIKDCFKGKCVIKR
jgi:ADP-glucose pyrophosphorylase